MKKWNVLIIGAGGQGALADAPGSGNEHKIISFAHAFKEHGKFNVFIYDKDPKKAERASKLWDIPLGTPGVEVIVNGCAQIADIIVIATPDDTHYELLKMASWLQPKLVICEKPICTDLQQAREIVALYKEKGIPLMVNYTRRFLPHYEELKARWQGKLQYASAIFNRGWLHTGSHAVDLFEWMGFKKYDVKEVWADDRRRTWKINMHFDDYNCYTECRYEGDPVWDYYDHAMWHVVNNAFEYLEGREPLKCTGEDALRTLKVCYNLMEGDKT